MNRLRAVRFDVTTYCFVHKLDKAARGPLMRRAEVISWHLVCWLRENKIELPDCTGFRVTASPETHHGGIGKDGKILYIPVVSATNRKFLEPGEPNKKYPLMIDITKQGIARVEAHLSVDLTSLKQCLNHLSENGYAVESTLASRRPRGLGVEFSIVSLLDANALSTCFVASKDGREIYREKLMQTGPWPENLKGTFNTITVDDECVSIPGRIFTKVPREELARSSHDLKVENYTNGEFYSWSRGLSEILSSGC